MKRLQATCRRNLRNIPITLIEEIRMLTADRSTEGDREETGIAVAPTNSVEIKIPTLTSHRTRR